jgi:ATP-dependent Lon protease
MSSADSYHKMKKSCDNKKKCKEETKKTFRNIKYEEDEDDDCDSGSGFETIDSSDEEDEDLDSDDEENEEEEDQEDEEEELNQAIKLHKLHKFVAKLYPSTYSEERAKKGKNIKKIKDNKKEDKKEKFNVVFNMSELLNADNDEYNSEYESESDYTDEKKGDDNDSEDEEIFMKESFVPLSSSRLDASSPVIPSSHVPVSLTPIQNKKNFPYPKTPTKTNKHVQIKINDKPQNFGEDIEDNTSFLKPKKQYNKVDKKKKDSLNDMNIEEEYAELIEMKKDCIAKLKLKPNHKYCSQMLEIVQEDIKDLVKRGRKTNTKQFYKLIHSEHKRKNEVDYFETKLSHQEQLKVIQELKTLEESLQVDKPYRLSLLQSSIPKNVKAVALQKLNTLKSMEPGDPEYFKLKNWVDAFMKIPFDKHKTLPVNINDGIDLCHEFMEKAHTVMNECAHGMVDAKMQIMQLIGQWITNPDAIGNAVALKGPPGTGKTTLIKEGVSKILGRDFIFIPLGGCTDGSYLEGNSYVYEGSSYGKIVQSLIECQSMNPVIYFDELDKVSDSPRGQEIIGILTHLTDTTQNSQFHDKYFSEIDFDLSKCLFMFSYNDEILVNPILKDRMYKIMTSGYASREKVIIGQKYLIPKILHQIKFSADDVIIPDSVLSYIVEHFTQKEEGVRNLKRCLEIIYTKLNLFRLVKPNTTTFFTKEINLAISFPHTVSNRDVDVLIKTEANKSSGLSMLYI